MKTSPPSPLRGTPTPKTVGRASPRAALTAPLRAARAFDAALAFVLDQKRLDSQCRTLILYGSEDCNRLLLLLPRLNRISQDTADLIWADETSLKIAQNNLRCGLADLAAYALIWATTDQPNYVRGCKGIAAARLLYDHQIVLGDRHTDCASPTTPPSEKFRVLFEQCGAVAKAIDQVQHHGLAPGNIHVDLIQLAAVCVAWLESFELSREGAKGAKAKA